MTEKQQRGEGPTLTRVVGYIRTSTGTQDLGLEAQERRILGYVAAHELHLVDIHRDQRSAKDLDRPGLQNALVLLEGDFADGLVVSKLDRLTRSVADASRLFERFKERGWQLHVIDDHIDTSTPMGEAMAQISAVFSQLERRLIGERTRDALAEVKAQGGSVGRVPFGKLRLEEVDEHGRRLVIVDKAARAVIDHIVELRDAGVTLHRIAAELNRRRLPTARGAAWSYRTVWDVLNREGRTKPRSKRSRRPR